MNSGEQLEQSARVVRVSDTEAWLQTQVLSACSSCGARKACGSGALAAWANRGRELLRLPNTLNARPGDSVVIALPATALLRAALLAYFLPLICMVVLAFSIAVAGFGDLAAFAGAVFGLLIGLLLGHRLGRRHTARVAPSMLRISTAVGQPMSSAGASSDRCSSQVF